MVKYEEKLPLGSGRGRGRVTIIKCDQNILKKDQLFKGKALIRSSPYLRERHFSDTSSL